ncbi:outer membrane porin, OprD family [compost metagenome]
MLKYGEQRPTAPVFGTGDNRLLPEVATGFQLSSNEFNDLLLEAGHFTAFNNRNSTNSDDKLITAYGGVEADSVNFLGGSYKVNDRLVLMAYAGEAEEIWRQYFGSATYTLPLSDNRSLSFGLVAYKTADEGQARAGELDTTSWSAKAGQLGAVLRIQRPQRAVHSGSLRPGHGRLRRTGPYLDGALHQR